MSYLTAGSYGKKNTNHMKNKIVEMGENLNHSLFSTRPFL